MNKHQRYRSRHAERIKSAVKKWGLKSRDKKKAHTKVRSAVLSGKIIKPDRCEKCKRLRALHGHHHDYSKPLDVEWLCRSCHALEHRDILKRVAACRINFASGENHGRVKLSVKDVRRIKASFGKLSMRGLARQFNVSPRLIGLIRRGEIWKSI